MLENMHAEAATQLRSVNPDDWPVAPGWQTLTANFCQRRRSLAALDFRGQRLQASGRCCPSPSRALALTPPGVRGSSWGKTLPRPRPGRGAERVLSRARRAPAALAAANIFGEMQARPVAFLRPSRPRRQPGAMGHERRAAAQHLPDGGGGPGRQPFRPRLGAPDRRRDPPCGRRRGRWLRNSNHAQTKRAFPPIAGMVLTNHPRRCRRCSARPRPSSATATLGRARSASGKGALLTQP